MTNLSLNDFNSLYIDEMTMSLTGITTKNKELIKGKESVTKNNMVAWLRESSLTFRICLLHHHPQRIMNRIHLY